MDTSKKVRTSKSMWGNAISLLAFGAMQFGFEFGIEDQAQLLANIEIGIIVLGQLYAMYGRFVAKHSLTWN